MDFNNLLDSYDKGINDEIDKTIIDYAQSLADLNKQFILQTQIPQSMLNNNNINTKTALPAFFPSHSYFPANQQNTQGGTASGIITSANNNLNPGMVYAPYIPLISTGQMIWTDNAVVYDHTKEPTKLTDKNPMIPSCDVFDEVLSDFGGVLQIIKGEYDSTKKIGVIICLMKDWRIFRFKLYGADFDNITYDEKVTKINHQCQIFEDMDDWSHWEETVGDNEIDDKRTLEEKIKQEKESVYGEKYKNALDDFFNGNIDSMSDVMKKEVE
jgi:hypothetical protein